MTGADSQQLKHYRDLLQSVLVRLRNLPRDSKTVTETQRECWRIADFIEANINRGAR